jgi:uncharacterized protein involved in exopolysaccharide biosynthesis
MKQKDKEEVMNDDEGVSVSSLFSKFYSHIKYLKTKWFQILIFAGIGSALGVYFAIKRIPQYAAVISFTVEDPSQSQSGIAGLASELGVSFGSNKQSIFAGYNIIAFFQSRLMVQKTLLTKVHFDKGDDLLVNRYIQYNHIRKDWNKDPKLRNITFKPGDSVLTRQQDSVLFFFYQDILYNHLVVDRADRRLTILTLNVHTPDELFSKIFAETLAKNVIEFYTQTQLEKTEHNIRILQHQTDSVRARLDVSLTRVASSIDAVPNANPLKKVLAVSQQTQTTQADIDRSALLELASNLQSAKISLNQETPLIDFIDTPILPLQIVRLSKLKGWAIGLSLGAILSISIITLRRKNY